MNILLNACLSLGLAASAIAEEMPPWTPTTQKALTAAGTNRAELERALVAVPAQQKSHSIVEQGLQILKNLTHRGAVGADPLAGDGAGILLQIPDKFLREDQFFLRVRAESCQLHRSLLLTNVGERFAKSIPLFARRSVEPSV